MNPEIQGTVYELKNEIQMLRAELAQLKGTVNLKVDKTDIVNQINVSQEGIRINADKIEISSNAISNAHIKDMKTPLRI